MTKFYPRLKSGLRFSCCFLLVFVFSFNLNRAQAQFGSYLSFDGVDDEVALPNDIVSNVTGDFTIEVDVFFRGGSLLFQRIIDLGTSDNNWAALTANSNVVANGPRFGILTGGVFESIDAPTALPQNTWTHIAVTLNGSTGAVAMYINGALSVTGNFTRRLSDLGLTNRNRLGESKYAGDPHYNGDIDELRISNVVRYTAPFTPPTVQFTSDANTVALFHFNEGSGQTTADASGNFGNATLGTNPTAVDAADPSWMAILPVKLVSFDANAAGKKVAMNWSAILENPTEFAVERSSDGIRFSAVTQVNALPNTGSVQDFNFLDNDPLSGRSYYRLKSTEAGETPVYSKIIPVNLSGTSGLTVYPNPVKGSLINIELTKAVSGNVEVKLYNASGLLVASKRIQANTQKQFTLPRNGSLAAGNYTIELSYEGTKTSEVIVLQ